jgi:flagellar basal-body rod protein FlgG
MIRGLYTSALGMTTSQQRMDVITNNMANVNTTGYKRDHVVSHAFSDVLITRINDPGMRMLPNLPVGRINPGLFVDDVFTQFTQGPMQLTGNALDLALSGQGFFVVDVDGEELFTRDGSFTIFNGMLLTADGGRVQGLGGDIILPNGYIVVDEQGNIFVNNEMVDTLRITTFTDLHTLRKLHDNFFRVTGDSVMAEFTGGVHQGYLEASNVNIVHEMVEMITLSRAFETNARMVTIQDNTLQHAVNDIARR